MADEYEIARKKARAAQRKLTYSAVLSVRSIITDFIEGITRGLPRLFRSPTAANQQAANKTIHLSGVVMAEALEQTIDESRDETADTVEHFWEQAGAQYAIALGAGAIAAVAAARLKQPTATLVGVWDDLSPNQWRTILRGYTHSTTSEVAAVVKQAMMERESADELASRLRRYVMGSEPFQKAFDGTKIDLRKIPKHLRGSAQQMMFNSQRIAHTEMQNARATAELQSFWDDPLVDAVIWELSPNRGQSWTPPDECDLLAAGNFYGLGPGVYPIRKCPPPPHPFDRCERRPRLREVADAGNKKPNPDLIHSPLDNIIPFPSAGRVTTVVVRRAREAAWNAIQLGMTT